MTRYWLIIFALLIVAVAGVTVAIKQEPVPLKVPAQPSFLDDPKYIAFGKRRYRIMEMEDAAEHGQLPSEPDTKELLAEVRSNDTDWRIRTYAMSLMPFLPDRESAIDALIAAASDRDPKSVGSGVVPMCAVTYLAKMKAIRAEPAIRDWIRFIEQDTKGAVLPGSRQLILSVAKRDLAAIESAKTATTQPTTQN